MPPGTPQVDNFVNCPAGKMAVGGGVTTTGYERDFIVQATGPANDGHGWQGNVKMESGNNITAHIYARERALFPGLRSARNRRAAAGSARRCA